MFTGLIEVLCPITAVEPLDSTQSGGGGYSITIGQANEILHDCTIGDSIAVNGTCLTVTEFDATSFKVGVAPETLRRTNLGQLKVGMGVNCERAMKGEKRFGGHFVQVSKRITPQAITWLLTHLLLCAVISFHRDTSIQRPSFDP